MSFFTTAAFAPTPGTAYEAFTTERSPMLPQNMYRPSAAGPAYLAGLGSHQYYAPLKQMRLPLQGLGDPLTALLGGSLDKAIEAVIIRSMPIVEKQMQPIILPLQIMSGVTLVAASAAAVFAFLAWRRNS